MKTGTVRHWVSDIELFMLLADMAHRYCGVPFVTLLRLRGFAPPPRGMLLTTSLAIAIGAFRPPPYDLS